MLIEDLLSALADLRRADARLAGTAIGSPERRSALHEVRRLERIAFAGVLRPDTDPRARRRDFSILQ